MLSSLEQKARYKIIFLKNLELNPSNSLSLKGLVFFIIFNLIIPFFLICSLASCHEKSKEQVQEEVDALLRTIIKELSDINTYHQLKERREKLAKLFTTLADLIILANKSKLNDTIPQAYNRDHEVSDKLRSELIRIYQIDGGKEVIEQVQKEAFMRLVSFEARESHSKEPASVDVAPKK